MEKEEKRLIAVSTVPNGYVLKIDKEEFLYFTELDLLAGFMVHVGTHDTSSMDNGTLMSTLASAMIGHEYAEHIENLSTRMANMANKQVGAYKSMDEMLKYVNNIKPVIDGFKSRVKEMDGMITSASKDYLDIITPVMEAKDKMDRLSARVCGMTTKLNSYDKKIADLDKIIESGKQELARIHEIRAAIEATAKESGVEIKPAETKKEDTPNTGRGGSRKKADKAILAAIEAEQVKGNLK